MLGIVDSVATIDTLATTYNFEVAATHNYFVGTEGVLVHNSCTINRASILGLATEVPTVSTNTLSPTKLYNKGERLLPIGEPIFDNTVLTIRRNGDPTGSLTENLSHHIFETKMGMRNYSNDVKIGPNNGYDGFYIEGSIQNPTRIVIVEAKPWTVGRGVELAPGTNTGLPPQMSSDWIEHVRGRMNNAGGLKAEIAQMLDSNRNLIEKYVITVNKESPLDEVIILKLGNY